MTINARRLNDLKAIAEHGSFGKAARAIGISQPALSNGIAAFERSLGVALLARTRKGATLTDYGRMLVDRADLMASLLARTEAELQLKKRGLSGLVSIGVSPVGCVALVPEAVVALRRAAPAVAVDVTELHEDALQAGLMSGRFDLTICSAGLIADPPEVKREVLASDRLVVAARAGHEIALRRSVTLRELRGVAWIMPQPASTMFKYIEAVFSATNEPWPASYVSTNSIQAIKALIAASDALSIMSDRITAADVAAGVLCAVPLGGAVGKRSICLRTLVSREKQPLIAHVTQCLREAAQSYAKA